MTNSGNAIIKMQDNIHNELLQWILMRSSVVDAYGENYYESIAARFNSIIDELDLAIEKIGLEGELNELGELREKVSL
jgi:hypothetical protein